MTTRRQTKKIETRANLIIKANELFSQFGVKEIGMRQLAKESGLGLGTYYNYFKNKDEIIFAISDSIFEELFLIEIPKRGKSHDETLSLLIQDYLEKLNSNKEVITQLIQVISHMDHYAHEESEGRKFVEKHLQNYSKVISNIFSEEELSIDQNSFYRLCWHQLMIFIYIWFMDTDPEHSYSKNFIKDANKVLVKGAI